MRQNRFYLEEEFSGQFLTLIDQPIVRQIKNVLRLKVGETFFLFNNQGWEVKVRIKDSRSRSLDLLIVEKKKRKESTPEVSLYLAILKKENFELAVQKAVESGVKKIIPLVTERTVKLGLKAERLKLIIKEASEQSGRFLLPELGEMVTFSAIVDSLEIKKSLNLFCDLPEEQENQSTSSCLSSDSRPINIFVGPEGGWSPYEQALAKDRVFRFFSLGSYVLRAETAAIVASWLAVNKKI